MRKTIHRSISIGRASHTGGFWALSFFGQRGAYKKRPRWASRHGLLEDTTIQGELILSSELSFEPYALVVDLIRNCAGSIMAQDEGHYGEIDMKEFQSMINEVLHDLSERGPLAPEKYEGLWEFPVTEILTLAENTLTTLYHFRSAVDYYHFLFLHFVAGQPNAALCQCCGRYFIPKTKKKTLYCDRILKDGKTCKEWGPILKHKLAAQRNEVIKAFDRAKRKMYKRYERAESGINQKPSEKDLSYAEYYGWLDVATKARDEYLEGKMGEKVALKIINGS